MSDKKFNYLLLGRLRDDCEYFLGFGGRLEKHLWAGNIKDQIEKMKELWNGFAENEKPEWLSLQKINDYEAQMAS